MKTLVNLSFIALLTAMVYLTQISSRTDNAPEVQNNKSKSTDAFVKKKDKKQYDKPDKAAQWLADFRQTPKGKNPSQLNMDIKREIQIAEKSLKSDGILPMRFDEIGPGVFGGRIRGFAIHPTKPGVLLAGGVSGGVWKSIDDGKSWHPKSDFLPNIAIGSMLVDPDNPERVFIGTGEGFFNFDAAQGAGIFVSEDFGDTWSQLTSTNQQNFYYVNRMARVPNSQILLAATGMGIMRSTNLGQTWQEVSKHATTGRGFTDLKRDPANDQHFLAYHFGNPNQVLAELSITAPSGLVGNYEAMPAGFGPEVPAAGISGQIVLARDGVGSTQDACEPITNNITGKIALIQRGTCDFTAKVKNAQSKGAVAVIVYQNDSSIPVIMGGEDTTITIPSVMINLALGNKIINSGNTVSAILKASQVTDLQRFVMRSTNGGAHWQQLSNNGLPMEDVERMEIGFAQTGKVYVAVSKEAEELTGGATNGTLGLWSASGGQNLQFNRTASQTNFIERQGWYDLAIAVNPNNQNHVLLGAIDLYTSYDGGSSIVKKSNWWAQAGSVERYMHADHHGYFFSPHNNNDIYFVTDGGVAKSMDGGNTFGHLNNGLNISQSYGIAVSPNGQFLTSGTQDNGSQLYFGDKQTWLEWQGGDGGYSAWDQQNSNYVYGSYVEGQMYGSSDGGLSAKSMVLPDTEGARFIQPFVLDEKNGNRMLVGTNKVYYSTNTRLLGSAIWKDVSGVISGASVSALAFNPHKPNQAFAGMANVNSNQFIIIDGLGSTNTVTKVTIDPQQIGYGSTIFTDIRVDAFDTSGKTIYATLGGYSKGRIIKSIDGGRNWISIAANLPNIPLFKVINDPTKSDRLFVGSELGLWVGESSNGFNYTWKNYTNYGPALTRVVDLVWGNNNTLYVGTHGRGTYKAQRNPISVSLLKFVGTDSSCDDDNYIDRGETGKLMLQVVNHSNSSLNQVAIGVKNSGALTVNGIAITTVNLAPFGSQVIPVSVSLADNASCAAAIDVPITVMTDFGGFETSVTPLTAVNQVVQKGDFFAGAETDDSMEQHLNLGNLPWKKVTDKVYSGNTSWFAPGEDNYSDKTLTSPWLTLAGGGNVLSFALAYETEASANQKWDGVVLEMQVKGENNWLDIGSLSTEPYDGQLSNNNTAQSHFAWSGNRSQWREAEVDLSTNYVGKTIRFRFRSITDTNTFVTGFWVDDIRLTNTINQSNMVCDNCINSGNIRPTKGSWYDPKHNGHGFIVESVGRDNLYYTMFYTYDNSGNPEWYNSVTTLKNGILNAQYDPGSLEKPKYVYTINPEDAIPVIADPSLTEGRLSINFNNAIARAHVACQDGETRNLSRVALAEFTINNENQTWCIEPIVLDRNKPKVDFGTSWYGGDNDAGWGYSIIQTNQQLQAYLFYYDADGNARWALADSGGFHAGEDFVTTFYQVDGYGRTQAKQPLSVNAIGTLQLNLKNTLKDMSTDGMTDINISYPGAEGGDWVRHKVRIKSLMQSH